MEGRAADNQAGNLLRHGWDDRDPGHDHGLTGSFIFEMPRPVTYSVPLLKTASWHDLRGVVHRSDALTTLADRDAAGRHIDDSGEIDITDASPLARCLAALISRWPT